ncbi:MAG: Cytosine/purine/uracil/thiamine/allantoin permease family protein [uncultured Thermoleophilia bacterium]|uniref:Cytosine/purine/uracil/thiamine/allantoin permease family protein n=1 Tax=uncultured Thermoleophilia bacterium TaxID=1497501 RepID=A0A6J4UEV6_9ACTN|nr:MAG: Cytosine/purine/uracil/thiamine/allantoin permease family protein [uncultured Thermoleophilia bacterium]
MATRTRETSGEPVPFDAHGIEPVPTGDRDSTPLHLFWIWMGANIAPINWVLGALGIILGLSLVQTILVVVVGNVIGCAIFGLFSVMGHRTGVNQMVLARSAFGRRGAYVPGVAQMLLAMGWLGVNTWIVLDLAMGVLRELGYDAGSGARYAVGFGIMLLQVLIAIYGYYAIRSFEKWTVPIAAAIMVLMTVLAAVEVDIAWNRSDLSGGESFTSMTQLMTAIGVGWGISWLTYSSDYSRFTRTDFTDRQVFWGTSLGMFIPTVWLATLGAAIASTNTEADPSRIVAEVFGVMTIPVLLVILHGPVATNILNIYSASLAALSLDIKIPRWKISAAAGVLGSIVLVFFLRSDSFAQSFDHWMISIIVWISPWAGITLVEYYVLRRGRVDVDGLYAPPERSPFGDVNWRAIGSLVAGLIAGWAWEFGLVEEFQGPVAKALGNTDFSWLAGMLVAGGLYYVTARKRVGPGTSKPTEMTARSAAGD